jgi:hypothetical protein
MNYILEQMINGWTIKLDKLPQYKAFSQPWTETLDYSFMQRISELPDNHTFFNNKGTFAEQKRHLKDIMARMNDDNLFVSSYRAKGIGRFYSKAAKNTEDYKKGISIICLSRRIKHTILKNLGWRDIDMCSAHPSILFGIAKTNKRDKEFPILERFTKDKRSIIDEIKAAYSLPENPLSDDDVKDMLSAFAYGGGFNRWLQDPNIPEVKNIGKIQIVADFQAECRKGIQIIYDNNQSIANTIKEEGMDEWDLKKRVFSYWCGIIENDILFIVYKYLLKEAIIGDKQGAKEYDGLCFKPLKEFDENEVCENLSSIVLKEWKFKMQFKFKDYAEAFSFIEPEAILVQDELIDVQAEPVPIDEYDNCVTYADFKYVFEKKHCKIVNKSFFIKHDDDKIIYMKKTDLITAYEHLSFVVNTKKGETNVAFINEWLKDKYCRKYEDIGTYPPPLKCPNNIFNLWTPFRAQTLPVIDLELLTPEDKDYVVSGAQMILKHIQILCNHEKPVYDYITEWIAQALVYPAIKTIMPTFISGEGAGKGTLMQVLKRLFGNSKILTTTNPARDVWGSFNSLMATSYLVILDELDPRSMDAAEGIIKGYITEDTMNINPKGFTPYPIVSYHRFISPTNTQIAKSKKGDRRNLYVCCSDELKGNSAYFNKINEVMNDDRVIYILYEYLINIPGLDSFQSKPIPLTNYQQIVQDATRDPLDIFLEYFTVKNLKKDEVVIQSSTLYNIFVEWRETNGVKYETSVIKIIRNIGLMKIPNNAFVTSTNDKSLRSQSFNSVKFDIKLLKKHYNLTTIDPLVLIDSVRDDL